MIKFLEIRDRMTFIPCFAFKPSEFCNRLAWRAGFPSGNYAVIFGRLDEGGQCQYDPYGWPNPFIRTMPDAHKWIEAHWDEIKDGDVIDVEFNAGESTTKKTSEL